MIENKLELNHTYLVKLGGVIVSMTVLMITNKAYHMRRNNGLKSVNSWEEINVFHNTYTIVEDITEFISSKKLDDAISFASRLDELNSFTISSRARKTCPTCGGTGGVEDLSSTAKVKLCPMCFGCKTIPSTESL